MKVEFEIPDFVPSQRIIHIIAGSYERIGYIEPHTRKVWVKTSQCSRCLRCCKKINCKDLIFKDGLWQCRDEMPFVCVIANPSRSIPECTVKFKEQ